MVLLTKEKYTRQIFYIHDFTTLRNQHSPSLGGKKHILNPEFCGFFKPSIAIKVQKIIPNFNKKSCKYEIRVKYF
jgi:hypothetical protein